MYKRQTIYRLTELSAPEGYLPSDEPQYFVWMEQGANDEQTVEKMRGNGALDGIPPDDIVFIPFSTSGTLYVPNELDQLTVTKKWQNENGEPMENPPSDSVKVTLYQWDADDRQSVYAQVELKEENGWSYTWKNLPRADDNGGEYRYTVEEAVSYTHLKVFPHNLRHLFARCFYSIDKDIAQLADVLGHSSINTTRIYIASSGYEHRKRTDALNLVI